MYHHALTYIQITCNKCESSKDTIPIYKIIYINGKYPIKSHPIIRYTILAIVAFHKISIL